MQTLWCAVGQCTARLIPDILSRVKLGSIGREALLMDSWMLKKKPFDLLSAMDRSPIPQQAHRPSYMFEQILQKRAHIQPVEIPTPKPKIKRQPFSLWGNRQGAQSRNPIPFIMMVEQRGLPLGRPGPGNVRNEQETGFIQKDQMGPTSFGLFLYAASDTASNVQSRLRSFVTHGAPVFGNSSPSLKVISKHGWGDTECQSVSGSPGQSFLRSKGRSDIPKPMVHPTAPAPISLSDHQTALEDVQVSAWIAAPWNHLSDTFGTIGRPSFSMLPPSAPPPIDSLCLASAIRWRVAGAFPVRLGSHGVSCPHYNRK